MVFRKLPGVSASGMGLRLSQKFVFLLFLSGLVTLCFGALFFLPDSVRLKRIFLSKTETQPVTVGSGTENDAREPLKRAKEPELPRGMTPARGETSTRLKNLSRKPTVSREAAEERLAAAGKALEDFTLPRSRTESASAKATSFARGAAPSEPFSYDAFKGCLLKPPLGRDGGRPTDPETNARREKVKEVRRVMPAEGGREGEGSSSGVEVSPHGGVIVDMQQPPWLSGHMPWSSLASEPRTGLCAIYVCF
ncbi:Mannosyl-oligosaccharide 1,2-alpha-mannosidase IC [Liparis tanakae]|uniref:Mannosyl-oligosaccharide 1,2-alpha-mannosidase IC n=1 Tax=Liparis tanakae TaxID=230148 RepID=A0A4Z2G4S3_9TELE|nr:Mannosyl-oligosaccharide 1,2-alpha-mannosidase IC [Liparis tanakae]